VVDGRAGITAAHFILYVREQAAATAFYRRVFGEPALDVPGMTEFALAEDVVPGLMPAAGIRALLGDTLPDPAVAGGVPRAELYLRVADPAGMHARAVRAGARELSPLLPRDWGDEAAYCLDPDGHVLVFARAIAVRGQARNSAASRSSTASP
jgi:catechol 2,3-dioxygenase-like lactoylglutathione lyase family enzyme